MSVCVHKNGGVAVERVTVEGFPRDIHDKNSTVHLIVCIAREVLYLIHYLIHYLTLII